MEPPDYRSLVERAPDVIALLDRSHRYEYINGAVEDMVGATAADLIGHTIDERMPPRDASRWRAALDEVLATGTPHVLECTIETPRGRRHISATLTRIEAERVLVLARDVSDIRTAATRYLAAAAGVLQHFESRESLQQVIDLAVPEHADWAFVHLALPTGMATVAIAHHDAQALAAARERARGGPTVGPDTPIGRVLAGGPPELAQIDDEILRRVARDPAHEKELRDVGYRSTIVAPLRGRDGVHGAVTFAMSTSGRVFDGADLEMVTELAHRIGIALENARLLAAAQHARTAAEMARDRTRRLQQLTAALSRAIEIEEVVEIFVDAGCAALGAAAGFVWLLKDPDTLELSHTVNGEVSRRLHAFQTISMEEDLPVCRVVRTREALVFDDDAALRRRYPASGRDGASAFSAWAVLPLAIGDRSIGAASFSFEGTRTFSDDDQALLAAISSQASQAFERCQLVSAERRARAEAESAKQRERKLHVLAARLSGALTRQQIGAIVCEEVVSGLRAQATSAALRIGDGVEVFGVAGDHDAEARATYALVPVAASMPHTDAIRTGTRLWCADELATFSRYPALETLWRKRGIKAIGVEPFTFEGTCIGALAVAFPTERMLGQEERELLHAAGQLAAQALERARLFEAHQTSDLQLRAALAAAHAATWSVDLHTMRATRDPSYLELCGITDADAAADFDAIHPDDRESARAAFERAVRDDVPYEPVVRVRRGNGEYFWIQSHGRVRRGPDGTPESLAGVMVDIDAAKHAALRADAERRINETMHRLSSMFASELDHDRLVALIVDELTKVVEADAGEFREGRETSLAASPHGSSLVVPVVSRSGELFGQLRFEHHAPGRFSDEHERLVTSVARQAAIALENARLYKSVREHKDALEEAVARVLAADRRKNEFLAMLGHELRNPLAPIATALDLMEMKGETILVRERDVIRRQVTHLTRLIDDLLDVARITRGKISLAKETIELASVLAKATEMVSPLLGKRKQQLETVIPSESVLIDADPTRLAQVFQNLLTNASKYSDPGTRIQVVVTASDTEVVVEVHDRGIGIPSDLLPHLFDLFVQGERTLDRSEGGLGIGLTIARSLVELHGGTIRVTSTGPRQGSTFAITLPRSPRARISTDKIQALPAPRASTDGARVLVVDDNIDAALMLRELLGSLGHTLEVAHDGASALALATTFKPDFAVLDIGLPVMNGYELARQLRNQLGSEQLRLIALTGYGQEADRARAREVGFDHHLIKPVDIDALLSLLRK